MMEQYSYIATTKTFSFYANNDNNTGRRKKRNAANETPGKFKKMQLNPVVPDFM